MSENNILFGLPQNIIASSRQPVRSMKLSDTSGFQSDIRVSADVTGNRSTTPRVRISTVLYYIGNDIDNRYGKFRYRCDAETRAQLSHWTFKWGSPLPQSGQCRFVIRVPGNIFHPLYSAKTWPVYRDPGEFTRAVESRVNGFPPVQLKYYIPFSFPNLAYTI